MDRFNYAKRLPVGGRGDDRYLSIQRFRVVRRHFLKPYATENLNRAANNRAQTIHGVTRFVSETRTATASVHGLFHVGFSDRVSSPYF